MDEKGKIPRKAVAARLKEIGHDAEDADERKALEDYAALLDEEAATKARLKAAQEALAAKVAAKYGNLGEAKIKTLVVQDKWLAQLAADVQAELDSVSQALTGRIRQLAARYAIPLPALVTDVEILAARVDKHLQLIDKKHDLKLATMQQLVTGQTRLPGFSRKWEVSTVGRKFDIQLGKMLDADRNRGIPKPYIGNKAVQWNSIDISDLPMVPMSRSDLDRFRLLSGDLLVCEGGEVGRAAIWEGPIDECYYQKALHRLRPRRGFNPRLMVELLRHWADSGLLANYVTQTSIAHLTREKLAEVPMPVPQPDEQRAIASVLSDIDANITALEQRLAKTRALKQGMIHELLTGRTRLV